MEKKSYPKGHFIGIGIATGIPIGIPISLALFGTVAVGPLIGAVIGVPIGLFLEKKYNVHPRKLTLNEKKLRRRNLLITLFAGIVILLGVLVSYRMHS